MDAKYKKICYHALQPEGCNLGDACPNWHPSDPEAAKAEQAAKATRSICDFYILGKCTKEPCPFLHVHVLPRAAAAPAAAAPAPGRKPPPGTTPARPDGRRDGAARKDDGRRDGAARKDAARKDGARKDGSRRDDGRRDGGRGDGGRKAEVEALAVLNKLRGKVNAIHKAKEAYSMLATAVPAGSAAANDANDKARRAGEMLEAVAAGFQQMCGQLDEYIAALGGSGDPETPDSTSDIE